MKKLELMIMAAISVVCLQSCSKDGLFEEQGMMNSEETALQTRSGEDMFTKFIYHGKEYESYYTIEHDSVMVYQNPEVQALAEIFDKKTDLSTFVYPDGTVEYFDTHDEFLAALDRVDKKSYEIYCTTPQISYYAFPPIDPQDKVNNDAELWLYDDTNFEDTRGIIVLKRGEKKEEIGHLKKDFSPNMNDKASSLAAFSVDGKTLFELFEDDSYRSHSMNFIVHRGSGTLDGQEFSLQSDFPTGPDHPIPDNPRNRVAKIAIFNLKSNHVVGTTNSTWNDRITSVRITRQ